MGIYCNSANPDFVERCKHKSIYVSDGAHSSQYAAQRRNVPKAFSWEAVTYHLFCIQDPINIRKMHSAEGVVGDTKHEEDPEFKPQHQQETQTAPNREVTTLKKTADTSSHLDGYSGTSSKRKGEENHDRRVGLNHSF